MSYLFDNLIRYGDFYELKYKVNLEKIKQLELYKDDWVKYNPRKNIERYGLSITSLDGGLSGIPDLDSIREYNNTHKLQLDEPDFNVKTELWPLVSDCLQPFEKHLGRTHIIRMKPGGHFPPHRDQYSRNFSTFRLFIPLMYCNPPQTYFILEDKILNFNHGHAYFINTCKEHSLFTMSHESMFVVANIVINEESIDQVLQHFSVR